MQIKRLSFWFFLCFSGLLLLEVACQTTPALTPTAVSLLPTETSQPFSATAVPSTVNPTHEATLALPITTTAVAMITETTTITTPTLINLEIPLITENLPDYGWFSEDSQIVHFTYPEEGVAFNYYIATQQLVSTTLSQKSDDQVIEQIKAELPADVQVVEISPRYQNILYTIPISQPVRLERGGFTVPLGDELWLYKEGESSRLGTVDECFLINLSSTILWSPSETLATVNAFAPMACAWSNWLIDLETFSVAPIDETWKEAHSGFYIASILSNEQLLLTALLQDEPSAILDLQAQVLTVFSNQGEEVVRYFDEAVLLDFLFWRSRDETEVLFSLVNKTEWQLIGTTEGLIRAKYVSPDQKQVLLFSGSPDYYGLAKDQESSGVRLLSFP